MFLFVQPHVLLVPHEELFCVEIPSSCLGDLSGSLHPLKVQVDFFEVRRGLWNLGKTYGFLEWPFISLPGFLFLLAGGSWGLVLLEGH